MTPSPITNSDAILQQLASYYSLLTPYDVTKKYATSAVQSAASDQKSTASTATFDAATMIMETVFNTSLKGLVSLADMERVFRSSLTSADNQQLLNSLITIRADGLKLKGDTVERASLSHLMAVPEGFTSLDSAESKIGYILSYTPRISLGVRDVAPVAAFMNCMPTFELARSVPYLSVNFKTSRPTLTENGNYLNAPTILRFIRGSAQIQPGSSDEIMALATSNPDGKTPGFDHMGMEIFTSPISMTPFSLEADPTFRSTRINDPFRPILSIEQFTVEVIPTIGVYQYKTANLNLILHDKSRLSEVSDLVRPEAFGGGENKAGIEITYGWSHPDDALTGNAYGALINRMRVTEVFSIVNSKFTMDPAGQMKISLSLATKGAYDVHRVKILDADIESETKKLQELVEQIKTLREQVGLKSSDTMKEVQVYQVLDSAESAVRPELKDFSKAVADTIKTLKASSKSGKTDSARKAAQKLADDLDAIYLKPAADGSKGILGKIDSTVSNVIAARFNYMTSVEDPFLIPLDKRKKSKTGGYDPSTPWDDDLVKFNTDAAPTDKLPRKNALISLGALLMTFVGLPFASSKTVSEVQFVFHTFNDFAGRAGGQNIAAFPIDFEYFKDIFQKLARQRRDPNYTLEEFTRIISEFIINNPRSVGYGMRSIYSVSNDAESKDALPKVELMKDVSGEQVANVMSRIMVKKGGSFKFPVLESFIETFPQQNIPDDDSVPTLDSSKNITRIHFYDKQTTPYEPIFDMLAAARGDNPTTNIDDDKPSLDRSPTDPKLQTASIIRGFSKYVEDLKSATTAEQKAAVQVPEELRDRGVKSALKAGGNIVIPGAVDSLRDFLRETVPTITYGSSLSIVKSADVSTLQDAQQQAIFMKRAGITNPTQPNGSDIGGLPVTVLPTVVNLSTLGCPLLALMQQFYVDLGTGTTVDNIYFVTGLTHEIGPGKFDTRIKMTPGEAYGKFKPIKEAIKRVADLLHFDKGGSG